MYMPYIGMLSDFFGDGVGDTLVENSFRLEFNIFIWNGFKIF